METHDPITLITYLDPGYASGQDLSSSSEQELRRTIRALINVWQPREMPDEFWPLQDRYLAWIRDEKGVVGLDDTQPSPQDSRVRLWQGDITRLKVDAIVNAANSALLGCFAPNHPCIDNAIHSAAGLQLRVECDQYMRSHPSGYREPTGQAVITEGYNLPAQHVIHTVGPIVHGSLTDAHRRALEQTYRSVVTCALDAGLTTLAICCISTGAFGFPQDAAAQIAVRTVTSMANELDTNRDFTVIFNVFNNYDKELYATLLAG